MSNTILSAEAVTTSRAQAEGRRRQRALRACSQPAKQVQRGGAELSLQRGRICAKRWPVGPEQLHLKQTEHAQPSNILVTGFPHLVGILFLAISLRLLVDRINGLV